MLPGVEPFGGAKPGLVLLVVPFAGKLGRIAEFVAVSSVFGIVPGADSAAKANAGTEGTGGAGDDTSPLEVGVSIERMDPASEEGAAAFSAAS